MSRCESEWVIISECESVWVSQCESEWVSVSHCESVNLSEYEWIRMSHSVSVCARVNQCDSESSSFQINTAAYLIYSNNWEPSLTEAGFSEHVTHWWVLNQNVYRVVCLRINNATIQVLNRRTCHFLSFGFCLSFTLRTLICVFRTYDTDHVLIYNCVCVWEVRICDQGQCCVSTHTHNIS